MNYFRSERVSSAPAVVWGVLFCASLLYFDFSAARLSREYRRVDERSSSLDRSYRHFREILSQSRQRAREYDLYSSLIGIIPQEKSFLRTRQAVALEVQLLRKDVGRRVGNQLQVLVDTQANKLYVKKGLKLLWQADCSVGRGKMLKDKKTGRQWLFATPRGEFRVMGRAENPIWNKPDWAFVEAGQPIPPAEDPSRLVEGELGQYVLNLGDGYLIHGTKDESALGRPVSHGCVRLGAADLAKLYKEVPDGTRVFLY